MLHIPPNTTNAKLVLIGTPNAGIEADILQGYYLVGRHSECQIRPKSSSVGERHCLLEHGAGILRVFDLKSETGTFVNEEELVSHKWRNLNNGDVIRCGKVQFEVVIEQVKKTSQPVPATSTHDPASSYSETSAVPTSSAADVDVASSELEAAFSEDDIFEFLDDGYAPSSSEAKVLTRSDKEPSAEELAFDESTFDDDKDLVEEMSGENEAAVKGASGAKTKRKKRKARDVPRDIPKPKKLKTPRTPMFSGVSFSDSETLKKVGVVVLALSMLGFLGYRVFKVSDSDQVRIIQEDY